jgi:hypothetical protein
MHMQLRVGALLAALMAAAPLQQADAQGQTSCAGRVVIDAIYQTQTGGNHYEYFFSLRNGTRGAVTVDVAITGFPAGVTLFSPSLPGIPLGGYATRSAVRFGRGTSGNIGNGTVTRAYDASPGSGPTVRLTNCRGG